MSRFSAPLRVLAVLASLGAVGCAEMRYPPPGQTVRVAPPPPAARTARPAPSATACGPARPYRQRGIASWYGQRYHGRRTASGQVYNMHDFTAAHRSLPFGSRIRVTNMRNGRSVLLTVNDRGPFVRGRVVDVSYRAAHALAFVRAGLAQVQIERVGRCRLQRTAAPGAPPAPEG